MKLLLKVLAAYSKMLEEREKLRKKLLSKKELTSTLLFERVSAYSYSKQRVLKLGHFLLRKPALERKPRVQLENLLLKILGVSLIFPINHLSKS